MCAPGNHNSSNLSQSYRKKISPGFLFHYFPVTFCPNCIPTLFGSAAVPFFTIPAPTPAPSKMSRRLQLRLLAKWAGSGGSDSSCLVLVEVTKGCWSEGWGLWSDICSRKAEPEQFWAAPAQTPAPSKNFRRLRLREKCTDSGNSDISNLERLIQWYMSLFIFHSKMTRPLYLTFIHTLLYYRQLLFPNTTRGAACADTGWVEWAIRPVMCERSELWTRKGQLWWDPSEKILKDNPRHLLRTSPCTKLLHNP